MRIRSQLILAAFLLAVVPLSAIVLWSYHSSRTALEMAYRREAAAATRQMDRRLATIRAELDSRLATVSALPLEDTAQRSPEAREAVVRPIVAAMGDFADLIESVEFQPIVREHPRSRPLAGHLESVAQAAPSAAPADAPPAEETEVPAPPDAPTPRRFVISIPPAHEVRKYVIAAEQMAHIQELGSLAQRLQRQDLSMEERKELETELEKAREALEKQIFVDEQTVREAMERAKAQKLESQRLLAEAASAWRAQAGAGRVEETPATTVVPPAPPVPKVASAGRVNAAPAVAVPKSVESSVVVKPAPKPSAKKNVTAGSADAAKEAAKTARKESLIFGRHFAAKVQKEGALVGEVTAKVSEEEVIRRVLATPADEGNEIPFAVDREGNVYTRDPASRRTLEQLGVTNRIKAGIVPNDIAGWIVSASTDKQSGLRIGVARPVGENLETLRRSAANNFSIGLGLIACALLGIVPLANHLTRDVELVTRGAERIAQGDLMTRLPVKSKNEFGQLSLAFNRMAEDLSVQQQQLVEQERARQTQELQQKLLEAEYERKSVELEEARRFQLSLLPKHVPEHQDYEVAVYTRTATEVGGDYYDFQIGEGGVMSIAVGDATGHGAKAGTMVTVVKTLFTAYDAKRPPREFLSDAAEKIKRMELGRMSMSLTLARFDHERVTFASAGMPPVFVHRARSGSVEEIAQEATPLGTIATAYEDVSTTLEPGDTILFMTDGLPELLNDAGQQFGYPAASQAFAAAASAPDVASVIAALTDAARAWHGEQPPNDDVTFVAVRVR